MKFSFTPKTPSTTALKHVVASEHSFEMRKADGSRWDRAATIIFFAIVTLIMLVSFWDFSADDVENSIVFTLALFVFGFNAILSMRDITYTKWEQNNVSIRRKTDEKAGGPGQMITINTSESLKIRKWRHKGQTTLYLVFNDMMGQKKRLTFKSSMFGSEAIDQFDTWLRNHHQVQ